MTKDKIILDFNDEKLRFSITKVGGYNIDTIYSNIDKFKAFVNDSVASDNFDKIFNTSIFQVALLNDETAYLDNLMAIYNAIAEGDILENIHIPTISERDMRKQLRARGYQLYRTKRAIIRGVYENATRVKKEE